MKAIISAFGVTLASAIILGGSLAIAVHSESANAGPVVENPVAETTKTAEVVPAVVVPDESPAVDPVKNDMSAEALVWRAHEIPDDRRQVRKVGPRFYPDPDNSLDLRRTGF